MKRSVWLTVLLLTLIGALAACGGGAPAAPVAEEPAQAETTVEEAPTEEPAVEEAPAEEAEAPTEEAAPESEAEAPAAEEAPAEEASGDMVAGRPAGGTDPDTGLEINPPSVVPGVDFIVRGEIVNANLTPQDSPEFVILAPSGTRYRIRSQHVLDITYEDGTQPALHEFQRGVLIQATVRQDEGAGATITVNSTDFTLLHDE